MWLVAQFTTGCSRLPPAGFKALQSNNGTYRKFNIQSIEKGVSTVLYSRICVVWSNHCNHSTPAVTDYVSFASEYL